MEIEEPEKKYELNKVETHRKKYSELEKELKRDCCENCCECDNCCNCESECCVKFNKCLEATGACLKACAALGEACEELNRNLDSLK